MNETIQQINGLPISEKIEIVDLLLPGKELKALWIGCAYRSIAELLRSIASAIQDDKQLLVDCLRSLLSKEMDADVRLFLENALQKVYRSRSSTSLRILAAQIYGQLRTNSDLNALIDYPEVLNFYTKFRQCNITTLTAVEKIRAIARI